MPGSQTRRRLISGRFGGTKSTWLTRFRRITHRNTEGSQYLTQRRGGTENRNVLICLSVPLCLCVRNECWWQTTGFRFLFYYLVLFQLIDVSEFRGCQ